MRSVGYVADDVVRGYTLLHKALVFQRRYEMLWRELEQLVVELEQRGCACGCVERMRQQLDAIRAIDAFQEVDTLEVFHR